MTLPYWTLPGAVSAALASVLALAAQSPDTEQPAAGLHWIDYDADGVQDALAVLPDGRSRLLRRDGKAYRDVTAEVGLAPLPNGLRAGRWADQDRDGDLDLYLVAGPNSGLFYQGPDGFLPAPITLGLPADLNVLDAEWRDVDLDGWLDLVLQTPAGPSIWLSVEGRTFAHQTLDLPPVVQPPSKVEPQGGAGDEIGETSGGSSSADLPDSTRGDLGTAGAGSTRHAVSGSGVSVSPGGSVTEFGSAGLVCAGSVEDASGGDCIPASRVPTLDALLPLSNDWFVDAATGRVGLGTTAPGSTLHVRRNSANANVYLGNEDITVEDADAALGLVSTSAGTFGSSLSFKEVGTVDNTNWGLIRTTRTEGNQGLAAAQLRFTYGFDPLPANNLSGLTLRGAAGTIFGPEGQNTLVGINTNTPISELHVNSRYYNNSRILIGASFGGNNDSEVFFSEDDSDDFGMSWKYDGGNNRIQLRGHNGSSVVNHMTVARDSGRVGFGTDDLDATFVIQQAPGTSSLLRLNDDTGTTVTRMTATGRVICSALEITGGGDLVEAFESSGVSPEPGSVVVLDVDNPGKVVASSSRYDRRVVGVVSGAGGIQHGIQLTQDGVLLGDALVAMTGRVYVKCCDEGGEIQAGDLLTSSSQDGKAMRATDPGQSFGSIIGKALGPVDPATGFVLVLVNLQ